MKCPYCNAEINENLDVCPVCAEYLTNKNFTKEKNINKKSNKILIIVGICAIAFISFFIYFIYTGMNSNKKENLYEVENGTYINSKGVKIYTLPEEYNIIGEYNEGHLIAGKFINYVSAYIGDAKSLMILCELSVIDNKGNITKLPFKSIIPVIESEDLIYVPVYYNGVAILINEQGETVAVDERGKEIQDKNITNLQQRELTLKYTEEEYKLEDKYGTVIKRLNHDGWGIVASKYNEGSMAIAKIVSNDSSMSDDLSYIDKNGDVLLKTEYHALYHYCTDLVTTYDAGFHNGLALVKDDYGKFIYINKKGLPVITLTTKDCIPYNFNEDLARIYYYINDENKNAKLVYINKSGKEIYSMPLKYLKSRFVIDEQIYNKYNNNTNSFKSIMLDKNSDLIYENYIYN